MVLIQVCNLQVRSICPNRLLQSSDQIHPPLASVPRTKLVVRRSAARPARSASPSGISCSCSCLKQHDLPLLPRPHSVSLLRWARTRPPWRPQRPPCSAATAAASAGCCWPAARRPRHGASARSGSPRCRTGCRPCT